MIRHLGRISILASLVASGCGKLGPPVPPTRFAERAAELAAVQRGANIVLSWPAPQLDDQSSNKRYIDRVEIYRLVERKDGAATLDPEVFEELAEMVGVLDRTALQAQTANSPTIEFTDPIDLSDPELDQMRLRYAVRYVNKRDQAGPFSIMATVEPKRIVAAAPTNLRVASEAQDEIVLLWDPPGSNADGSQPASFVGYNIYRRAAGRPAPHEPLNPEPLAEPKFTDRKFRYRAEYIYTVRAVTQSGSGFVESADSAQLRFRPIDRFPPSQPGPVSIASTGGVISLFWPSNPEQDVIGYNVYRAESPDQKNWIKLNSQPLSTVTFRDERVVVGTRYYYRVTAVDRFDNESEPSPVVSQTANP